MGKWDYAAWSLREATDEVSEEARPMVKSVASVLPQFWGDAEEPARGDLGEIEEDESIPETPSPTIEEPRALVETAPLAQVAEEAVEEVQVPQVIGQSTAVQEALGLVQRVAETQATVLVEGEIGTGKGLFATEIHRRSNRSAGGCVVVGCAAESHLEARLFGLAKGAVTGMAKSAGLFQRAAGGTLVLKEISDAGPRVQAKLVRAIQDRTVEPLGSHKAVDVDVRLVFTTSRDLAEEVRAGRFRADLFYRLSGVKITLPPLRERTEDIRGLVEHFVATCSAQHQRETPKVSSGALAALKRRSWPGNVRELESAVSHAVVMCGGGVLEAEHLPADLETPGPISGTGEGQPTEVRATRQRLHDMVTRPSLPDADSLLGELLRVAHVETSTVTGAAQSVGYSYPRFRDRLVSLVILPALKEAGGGVDDEQTVREVALGLGIHPKVLVDWVEAEDRQKKKRSVDKSRSMEKTTATDLQRKKA